MSMSLDFKNIQSKAFVDIPASRPSVRIPIQKVGISNRPLVLELKNPLGGESQNMSVNLKVFSSLVPDRRGIHMSRIEECMDELRGAGLDPMEFSRSLAGLVLKTQDQGLAGVKLDACFENRVNKNQSGKSSVELIKFHCDVQSGADGEKIISGLTVPFMNACPCTQRWAMRDFYNLLKSSGLDEDNAQDITKKAPLQAHTNGGEASLLLSGKEASLTDIYNVLDKSLPIIRELLKGIDEHTFVSMTHKQGQFCEDNIRAIAFNAVKMLSEKLPTSESIQIKVDVNESVHFHNLWANLEMSFGELQALFSDLS